MRKQTQFITNQNLNLTKNKFIVDIPRDKYLFALRAHFRGQISNSVAGTTIGPEGILQLLERFRIRMTHEIFGGEVLVDMYGPALYHLNELYQQSPNRANLSQPLSTQTNLASNFDFLVDFEFPPQNIFPADQEFYLLDAPRCSLLQLDLEWGNGVSVIQGGTTALTAFASGSGTPSVDLEMIQVLDKEDLPLTALCRRYSTELDISASPFPVTNDKIRDLPTGEAIRSVMFRQYIRDTTAGQPTSVAATILDPVNPEVDTGITRIGARVNEKFITHGRSWQNLRERNRDQFRVLAMPIGIGVLDWVEDGNVDRVLFTQDFVEKRLRLDIGGSVVTAANARAELTFTTIKPNPQMA